MADLSAIQSELEAAESALAEAAWVQRRLASLREAQSASQDELEAARGKLDDERRDVAGLESFSPTRIWAALRGTRLDDLAREQAEVRAAEYAVAVVEARITTLRDDERLLSARAAELVGAADRRERALAAKEAALTAAGGERGGALAAIAAEVGAARSELKEVSEAFEASTAAATVLQDAATLLRKARGWAGADTWLGGGLLTDAIKYDRMDQANALLREADGALTRLAKELGDLGRSGVPGLEVSGLTRTFDVWFDNIFSDWSVLRRIEDAEDRTARAFHAVADVRRSLFARRAELNESLRALGARREAQLRG